MSSAPEQPKKVAKLRSLAIVVNTWQLEPQKIMPVWGSATMA